MANEAAVNKLPSRSEIAVEDTWRLEDIFVSDEELGKGISRGKGTPSCS